MIDPPQPLKAHTRRNQQRACDSPAATALVYLSVTGLVGSKFPPSPKSKIKNDTWGCLPARHTRRRLSQVSSTASQRNRRRTVTFRRKRALRRASLHRHAWLIPCLRKSCSFTFSRRLSLSLMIYGRGAEHVYNLCWTSAKEQCHRDGQVIAWVMVKTCPVFVHDLGVSPREPISATIKTSKRTHAVLFLKHVAGEKEKHATTWK